MPILATGGASQTLLVFRHPELYMMAAGRKKKKKKKKQKKEKKKGKKIKEK